MESETWRCQRKRRAGWLISKTVERTPFCSTWAVRRRVPWGARTRTEIVVAAPRAVTEEGRSKAGVAEKASSSARAAPKTTRTAIIVRIPTAQDSAAGVEAWQRRQRGDTPAAFAAAAFLAPSAEGLVVMPGDEWAAVSPAREAVAVQGGWTAQRRQMVDRGSCARLGQKRQARVLGRVTDGSAQVE